MTQKYILKCKNEFQKLCQVLSFRTMIYIKTEKKEMKKEKKNNNLPQKDKF